MAYGRKRGAQPGNTNGRGNRGKSRGGTAERTKMYGRLASEHMSRARRLNTSAKKLASRAASTPGAAGVRTTFAGYKVREAAAKQERLARKRIMQGRMVKRGFNPGDVW